MNYFELQQEINELQSQLDMIQQQQQDAEQENTADMQSLLESHSPKQLVKRLKQQLRESGPDLEFKEQLQDLVEELEQQLEQLPPKACLLVFSAGVIFGRVLR